MRIARIEAIPLKFPFVSGGPAAGWRGSRYSLIETILVRVETEDGIVGWGEAFSYNCQRPVVAAIEDMVAPAALGRDSRNIAGLLFDIQKLLHIYGRYGILNFALSGLDIALWDVAAKRAGRPLAELLGGIVRSEVEAYASIWRYDDPALVAERCQAVLAEGYRRLKLHVRGDAEVAATRAAIGPHVPLAIDTNCSWSPAEARRFAERLEPLDLGWLEEPIFPPEDFLSLAALGRATRIPLAAGENACTAYEFQKLIAAGAVSLVQPSVTKIGGITEFRKVAALTEAHGLVLQPHSPYFGPGFLATLHLIAAQPQAAPIERFHIALEGWFYGSLLDPVDGRIALPSGPGLGLDPDPAVIARYRIDRS